MSAVVFWFRELISLVYPLFLVYLFQVNAIQTLFFTSHFFWTAPLSWKGLLLLLLMIRSFSYSSHLSSIKGERSKGKHYQKKVAKTIKSLFCVILGRSVATKHSHCLFWKYLKEYKCIRKPLRALFPERDWVFLT